MIWWTSLVPLISLRAEIMHLGGGGDHRLIQTRQPRHELSGHRVGRKPILCNLNAPLQKEVWRDGVIVEYKSRTELPVALRLKRAFERDDPTRHSQKRRVCIDYENVRTI